MKDCPVYLCENGDYWQARWKGRDGRLHSRGLGSREKVSKRQARVLCGRMAAEMVLSPVKRNNVKAPTIEQWTERYLHNRPELNPKTLSIHKNTCEYLKGYFHPDLTIDKIDPLVARDWRSWLYTQNIKEATVCRHVRTAKVVFKHAVQDGVIESNPFKSLNGTAPKPVKDWRYVDQPTMDRLMDACPNLKWKLLLALCRYAGLRQGEALTLRWSDVDFAAGRMTVNSHITHETTKKKRRVVPIDAPKLNLGLEAILTEGYQNATDGDETVIPNASFNNLFRDFHKIAKRAGIPPYAKWCHTLRKNYETDLAQVYPQYVVCAIMGHSMEVSQDHYLQVPDDVFGGSPLAASSGLTHTTTPH